MVARRWPTSTSSGRTERPTSCFALGYPNFQRAKMRSTPGNEGSNIEDRRGDSGGGGGIGGIHLGIGGTIIVLVLSLLFHRNLFTLLGSGDSAPSSSTASGDQSAPPTTE